MELKANIPDGPVDKKWSKHRFDMKLVNPANKRKHKVIVVAMRDQGNRLPEEKTPLPPPIVPVKYTSPATTTLTATVEDKENTIDFDLKDG